jgi:DNA-binding transcriptional ArsR family regulator
MVSNALFAEIAALSGDLARATMLQALMDGRALTASELARAAGVTAQTASGHLGRMATAGLLAVTQQGRHRYHRLASPAVARMVEGIMQVAAEASAGAAPHAGLKTGPRDPAMRRARTCYDHFAGELGVALTDALAAAGHVELGSDAGELSEGGLAFLGDVGVETGPILAARTRRGGRMLCRPCLDWSERRPHLAGVVGAAICACAMAQGWTRRLEGTRAVQVTPLGARVFREKFGATF